MPETTEPSNDVVTDVKAERLPVYIGPRLSEGGMFLPMTSVNLGGQRESTSWLVELDNGKILVNTAVFTPPKYRWRYGYRWHGLQIVSMHRPTAAGLRMLDATVAVVGNLHKKTPQNDRLKAVTKEFQAYEVSGFVTMYVEEFPFLDGGDPAFEPAATTVVAKLDILGAIATPPRPLTLDGTTTTIEYLWADDPWSQYTG